MQAPRIVAALVTMVAVAAGASAQEPEAVGFERLWSQIRARSPAVRAASLLADAETHAAARASRHWYPRVSVEGRVLATDDPAESFFGLLAQRSIEARDFEPDALNHPDVRVFERLAFGADWPIWEGGLPSARARSQRAVAEQRAHERDEGLSGEYVRAASLYAGALATAEHAAEVRELRAATDRIVDRYELGSPDNPLGYSGLLGLRALVNRLDAAIALDSARGAGARAALSTLAGRDTGWTTERVPFDAFVARHLAAQEATGPTPSALALESAAEAAEGAIAVERAAVLPQLGLFAQVPVGGGGRDVAVSIAGGAYLRWRLDPTTPGATTEAAQRRDAARSRAQAQRETDDAEAAGAREELAAAEASLELLAKNEKLLAEQVRVATQLFRNGAINALQLVEVLGRRADTLDAIGLARRTRLDAIGRLARHAPFAVPGDPDGR